MRFSLALLLMGIWRTPVLVAQMGCTDIASIDFRNRVITASRETHPVFYGEFNGPAPGGTIEIGRKPNQKPDWLTETERDVVVHPPRSGGVRVLSLLRTHLTGTGSFRYVFAFTCEGGAVRRIFEASGEGLQLQSVTVGAIDVSVAVWAERDAHASPSKVVRLRYLWSPRSRRYRRSSSNAECPWMP